MGQSFKNSLRSQFDFGERREADMIYDDPTPSFRDPLLGRKTRFDALQRDSVQHPNRTYYQTGKNPQDFLFCGGRAFAPQKRFVKPMNEGTREIRPVSQIGRYEPLPIPLRQILEPNVGIAFEEPDTIPNYQQKFIPKKTPMEELTRNFLSQSIDKMRTDQTRVDRDSVIQMLQGLGLFESSDANKPLSALIEKANASLPPESQLPIVNETLANLEKGRNNQATNQNARDARAIEAMRKHNQAQQQIRGPPPSQLPNLFPSSIPIPSTLREFDQQSTQNLPVSRNLNSAFQGASTGSAGNIVPETKQEEAEKFETRFDEPRTPSQQVITGRKQVNVDSRKLFVGPAGGIYSSFKSKKPIKNLDRKVARSALQNAGTSFLNNTGVAKLTELIGPDPPTPFT